MKFRIGNNVLLPECEKAREEVAKLKIGGIAHVEFSDKDPGSVNMLRTWRGWMGETARHMAHMGCTMPLYIDSQGNPHGSRPFNADDAHELFTSKYLGSDESGRRKSWTMSRKDDGTVQASIGDRLWAMDRHLEWATEKGIKLTIPRNSEYTKLKAEQGEAQAERAAA